MSLGLIAAGNLVQIYQDRIRLNRNTTITGTLNGYNIPTEASNYTVEPYFGIVKSSGVMEIGRYLDWHNAGSTSDYNCRMYFNGTAMNIDREFYSSVKLSAQLIESATTVSAPTISGTTSVSAPTISGTNLSASSSVSAPSISGTTSITTPTANISSKLLLTATSSVLAGNLWNDARIQITKPSSTSPVNSWYPLLSGNATNFQGNTYYWSMAMKHRLSQDDIESQGLSFFFTNDGTNWYRRGYLGAGSKDGGRITTADMSLTIEHLTISENLNLYIGDVVESSDDIISVIISDNNELSFLINEEDPLPYNCCPAINKCSTLSKDFVGVITRIYEVGDKITYDLGLLKNDYIATRKCYKFASHGDCLLKVPNSSIYSKGDIILSDLSILDDDTPITGRILKSKVGKVTKIINDTTVSIFM